MSLYRWALRTHMARPFTTDIAALDRHGSARPRHAMSAVGVAAILLAACSGGGGDPEFADSIPPITRADADTSVQPAANPSVEYQFEPVPLGAGGWVTGIDVHPDDPERRWVRTDVGGAYRWDAADERWHQMISVRSIAAADRQTGDYSVESLAAAPTDADVVYLAVGNDGPQVTEGTGRVLASGDGGRTWSSTTQRFVVSGNGEHRQRTERLAVDPFEPGSVLLGTRREGIWRSDDFGATFTQVRSPERAAVEDGAEPAGVAFIVADPDGARLSDGRAAEWFAGVEGFGVIGSGDGGRTWEIIREIGPTTIPLGGHVVAGHLYVAFDSGNDEPSSESGVARWDGQAWQDFDVGVEAPRWTLAVDESDPGLIVVSTGSVGPGTIFVSFDSGQSWAMPDVSVDAAETPWIDAVSDGSAMAVGNLDIGADGLLWFAEGLGVWSASIDEERLNWQLDSTGIEQLVVSDIVTTGATGAVIAVADWQGFVIDRPDQSPDRPLVDARFAGGVDLDLSGRVPGAVAWAGAEYHLAPRFREGRGARSADGGASWTEMDGVADDFFGGNIALSATDPDGMVWVPSGSDPSSDVPEDGRVRVTNDGGSTWSTARTVDASGESVAVGGLHRLVWWFQRVTVAADRSAEATFYLVDDEAQFFVSTDGGFVFVLAPYAPPCRVEVACHVVGAIRADPLIAGTIWASTGAAGLHRSEDAGATPWLQVGDFERVGPFGFGAPASADAPATLFVEGTRDGRTGIWRSVDDGLTFVRIVEYPGDSYDAINVVTGDVDDPSLVYVGFAGSGAMFGRPAS